MENIPEDKKIESIKNETISLLEKHNIDYKKWGIGSAKTISHLVKEIEEGEVILQEDNGLFRKISILYIDVIYKDEFGNQLRLVEEKQIFRDGRERVRKFEEAGSVAEKLKGGENPDQKSVKRAISEELGIEGLDGVINTGIKEAIQTSMSYPGLRTKIIKNFFIVYIKKDHFISNGYIEHQADKDTYFKWIKI